MKKINLPLLLVLALFSSLLFASCKKDYTCACNAGVPFFFDTVINIEMENYKKKQAEQACEDNAATIQIATSSFIAAAIRKLPLDSLGSPVVIPANAVFASCELK